MTTDFETELARGDKWKAVEVLLRGGDGATTSFQSNPHPPLSHFGVAGSELDHQVMEEESLGLEGAVLRSPGGNDLGGSHDPMSVAPPDPFAPSTSTSPPDPRGSPGDRRKARKARKDLSAFLFEVLVQGLASEGGKSSRIPPSLSLGDVLYLVYSLRPEDGDRPSPSSVARRSGQRLRGLGCSPAASLGGGHSVRERRCASGSRSRQAVGRDHPGQPGLCLGSSTSRKEPCPEIFGASAGERGQRWGCWAAARFREAIPG